MMLILFCIIYQRARTRIRGFATGALLRSITGITVKKRARPRGSPMLGLNRGKRKVRPKSYAKMRSKRGKEGGGEIWHMCCVF